MDLLAVGHTAFDYIIQVKEFPNPNSSTAIKKMRTFYGGAAANVAVVAANLGLNSALVSAVGNDFIDSEYSQKLNNLNINTSRMILIEHEKTPTAFVLTDSKNDQISYFYWGAAAYFKKSSPPEDLIKKSKAVHLATGDPSFNRRCGEIARKHGKLISFDPGQDLHMYSVNELKRVLNICDILFGNHFEIDRILETLKIDMAELRKMGPAIVVKTYGKEGSIIYTDKEIKVDAIVKNTFDPTGAGDSYRSGFVNAYMQGEDLEDCGKFASSVASFIVESEGCQTNVPTLKMVKDRMKEEWGK
ncbi:MAG: carbohydrate kinase family protein [Methanomicrobiales archaeon]